jgi:hypothetical protein
VALTDEYVAAGASLADHFFRSKLPDYVLGDVIQSFHGFKFMTLKFGLKQV